MSGPRRACFETALNRATCSTNVYLPYQPSSFQRASHAQLSGFFKHEIVPIEAFSGAPGSEGRKRVIVSEDDGIRHGTTAEALGKIRAAFPQWGGKTTGGNASQITDGAAAVLLMRRSKAEELGLKVISKWVTTAVVGKIPYGCEARRSNLTIAIGQVYRPA